MKSHWINLALIILMLPLIMKAQLNDKPRVSPYVGFDLIKIGIDTLGINRSNNKTINPIPQNKYRENGDPHIIYTNLDNTILRKEYFHNGSLKSKSEIKHILGADTLAWFDKKTKKEYILTESFLYDIIDGEYIDYYPHKKHHIKSKGNCVNSFRVGQWVFYDKYLNKTIINYSYKNNNWENNLDGKYQEYSFSSRDSSYTLILDGSYGHKTYNVNYNSRKTGEPKTYQKNETRRIGTWKYYSQDGTLLEVTEHKWLLNPE